MVREWAIRAVAGGTAIMGAEKAWVYTVEKKSLSGGPLAKKAPSSQCKVLSSIPGQRTKSVVPQLRFHMPQLKTPHATNKIPHSQIK